MVKELERRQKLRRAVYSWPSLFAASLVTFLLVKGAFGIMKIERESMGKVKELERESAALALHESELQSQVERLKTPEGVVEEIKDKFSAVREGEYVAIIVDEKTKATTSSAKGPGFWKGLWVGTKNLWQEKP